MLDKNLEFDFKKLHRALSETYRRQMEIKKEFPHRFSYPVWTYDKYTSGKYKKEMDERAEWYNARIEFDNLSLRMTMLCCIINHAKGKLHMTNYRGGPFTMEDQESFISQDYEEFIIPNKTTTSIKKAKVDRPAKQGFISRITSAFGL